MEIWELDRLVLFVLFVMPGLISAKIYELLNPGVYRPLMDRLIDVVTYSCINYAVLAVPVVLLEGSRLSESVPFLYYGAYFAVFFLMPVAWAFLWHYLRTRDCFQRFAPHPQGRPWDYVFSKRETYWVKATLKNGQVIGGRYESNSFSSSSPEEESIYLEEAWILNENGGFVRQKNQSAGVIILPGELSYIELRKQGESP